MTSTTCGSLLTGTPSLSSTGYVTATPITFAYGSCQILFTLQDNRGTANGGQNSTAGSFTLTILHVNQQPYFTTVQNLFVYNEYYLSGAQISATVASGISPGAPNEVADNVVFNLSPSTSTLLTGPATLSSADGILRFKLAQ